MILFYVIAIKLILLSVWALRSYSREGDLANVLPAYPDIPSGRETNKLVSRLYKLAVYKSAKVRWHVFLAMSLGVAMLTLALVDRLTPKNLVIALPFVFAGFYIPYIYDTTHVQSALATEATMLYHSFQTGPHAFKGESIDLADLKLPPFLPTSTTTTFTTPPFHE